MQVQLEQVVQFMKKTKKNYKSIGMYFKIKKTTKADNVLDRYQF